MDCDIRTSECVRYCSNILSGGPSISYLPSNKAKKTPISNEREKIMVQLNPTQLRGFFCMQKLHSQIIIVVYDCLLNVNNDNVPVSIPNLNELKKSVQSFFQSKNES